MRRIFAHVTIKNNKMKKFLFAFLGFLSFTFINAQELQTDKVDEFTGDVKKITKTYEFAKGVSRVKGYVARIQDIHAIYMYSTLDMGCGGASGNYVIFLFEDGTNLKLDSDVADIDCADYATSIYVLDPKDFEGKVIKKIRFAQSESYDDCEWSGPYTVNELLQAVQ
jgi:hypothetical protein